MAFFFNNEEKEMRSSRVKFYIVGSALTTDKPRDVDLVAVIEDKLFKSLFDMNAKEFIDEDKDGPWSEGRIRWGYECSGAKRVLQYVFPELTPIDFKIIPRSLLREPNREIDLTSSPDSWGIGFPGLGD